MGGSTESFRSGEFQLEQISVGGDFRWQNVRGRFCIWTGSSPPPRPAMTPALESASGTCATPIAMSRKPGAAIRSTSTRAERRCRNLRVLHRTVQLLQLRQLDVSTLLCVVQHAVVLQRPADTVVPDKQAEDRAMDHQRWQSYGKYNGHRGLGGQILYRPYEWLSLVFNNYGNGTDDLNIPGRSRIHTDDSVEVRYYNNPRRTRASPRWRYYFWMKTFRWNIRNHDAEVIEKQGGYHHLDSGPRTLSGTDHRPAYGATAITGRSRMRRRSSTRCMR